MLGTTFPLKNEGWQWFDVGKQGGVSWSLGQP